MTTLTFSSHLRHRPNRGGGSLFRRDLFPQDPAQWVCLDMGRFEAERSYISRNKRGLGIDASLGQLDTMLSVVVISCWFGEEYGSRVLVCFPLQSVEPSTCFHASFELIYIFNHVDCRMIYLGIVILGVPQLAGAVGPGGASSRFSGRLRKIQASGPCEKLLIF